MVGGADVARVLRRDSAPADKTTTMECLIFDNDPPEDLSDLFRVLRNAGFTVVHKRGLDELASYIEECVSGVRHPTVLLLDVHIPNFPNLGLLGKPDVKLESADTAGTVIYEGVILTIPEIREVPAIFISSHNNIAVLSAFRLRKEGRKCVFVSKQNFENEFDTALEQLDIRVIGDQTEGFSGKEYEQLWIGIVEYYRVGLKEEFSLLGLLPDSKIDFLHLLSSSVDAQERVNILIDIGICFRALYDGVEAEWSGMNSDKLRGPDGRTPRQTINRGNFAELIQLRARLERLCGAK
jgi:hypothetical protein